MGGYDRSDLLDKDWIDEWMDVELIDGWMNGW